MNQYAELPSTDLVYIAIGSLTDTSWYNTQRLGTTMANAFRVLYVDLPATINEAMQGRKPWPLLMEPLHRREPGLYWHCPAHWLPYSRRSLTVLELNQRMARMALRDAVRSLGMHRPVVWIDDPYRQDYLDVLDPSMVVYNSLHAYETMPYQLNPRFSGEAWSQRNVELEQRLLRRADLAVTPSAERVERFRQTQPNSHLLLHGVEIERYRRAEAEPVSLPDIDAIPGPRVGFLGTVGRKKIDFDMLISAVEACEDLSFVFVGRTFNVISQGSGPPSHPRLHYLGEKPHALVPHYFSRFDVSIIPYFPHLIPDQTLKLFESMAVGHPVVVPDLPQFRQYVPLVYCYDGPASFVDALRAALAEKDPALREQRRALAADHSFERQVERACGLIAATPTPSASDR